jgi:hypothetical protein
MWISDFGMCKQLILNLLHILMFETLILKSTFQNNIKRFRNVDFGFRNIQRIKN